MKKLTRQSLFIAVSAVICGQVVAQEQEEQPYTDWCDQAPYCTVEIEGSTFHYPVGWRIDDEQLYRGKRRIDGMIVQLNFGQYGAWPDCMEDPTDNNFSICFGDAESGNHFYPISQYERNTWLGHPMTDNGYLDKKWQWLDAPVTVILKWNGSHIDATQIGINAHAAQLEIDKADSQIETYQEIIEVDDGQAQFTTNVADRYQISLENADSNETFFTNTIVVKPSPGKQCFRLSPNQTDDYPLQAVDCSTLNP